MIFVTLGSQKFQFNRLLQKIEELISQGIINEEIFAQTGYSDYRPYNYKFKDFLDRDVFATYEAKADIVITHGGTGAIIGAVKQGKKVIAVPRLSKYGEHVDDHQIQLLNQFVELDLICACNGVEDLPIALKEIRNNEYKKYKSNTEVIIRSIEDFMKTISKIA